jgi:cellulose 1,4-beta-cellobiosidase
LLPRDGCKCPRRVERVEVILTIHSQIWEANSISAAYTPHVCKANGLIKCSGTDCGDGDDRYSGVCDKDGCDFNSYRQGDTSFYGPGKTVDTKSKFTVVTQFVTSDGTDTGKLTEIRRKYVQNGKVIDNSVSKVSGVSGNSITDSYCAAQKTTFGDDNQFAKLGGLNAMGGAIGRGMVLALSVWDDHAVNMLWLDSTFPTDKPATSPGVARGTCDVTSGAPTDIETNSPNSQVIYSNIKIGAIGSTFGSGSGTSPGTPASSSRASSAPSSTPTSGSGAKAPLYGQCGGATWNGPTTCASGTCKKQSQYYSQCLP